MIAGRALVQCEITAAWAAHMTRPTLHQPGLSWAAPATARGRTARFFIIRLTQGHPARILITFRTLARTHSAGTALFGA